MDNIVTQSVTVTKVPMGYQISVQNMTPDDLFIAAAMLTRQANQTIDAAMMQQAMAQQEVRQVVADLRRGK